MGKLSDVLRVQLQNMSLAPLDTAAFGTPVNLVADTMTVEFGKARQAVLGPVTPAFMQAAIQDDTGNLDPGNPSGPYYAGLVPERAVRVVASDDSFSTSEVLFKGLLDDVAPEFDASHRTTVLTASGIMRYIGEQDWDDDGEPFRQYEFTGERITRALDRLDIPAGWRGTEEDGVVLVPPETASGNALAYMQELARAEAGVLWESNDGLVNYHEHNHHLAKTSWNTSQVTFTEDGAGGTVKVLNDARLISIGRFRRIHRVTASGYTGRVFAYGNTPTDYLPTTRAETGTKAYFDADAWAIARHRHQAWNYNKGIPAQIRVAVWTAQGGGTQALTELCNGKIDLLNRVTVELNPPGYSSTESFDCIIESIGHSIDVNVWYMTLGLSAYDALPSSTGLATWSGSTAGMAPAV